jgi:hypothetical protein
MYPQALNLKVFFINKIKGNYIYKICNIYSLVSARTCVLCSVSLKLLQKLFLSVIQDFRARICKRFKSPGINFASLVPVRLPYLPYRPARLHRLVESIPWNRFLSSLNVYKFGLSSFYLPFIYVCRTRNNKH